jgi:hypothetical protein
MSDIKKISSTELASFLLAGAALLLILHSGLLAALYSGLLVYALVHLIAPALSSRMSNQKAKLTSVAVLGSVIVLLLTVGAWVPLAFFLSDDGSYPVLLKKMTRH